MEVQIELRKRIWEVDCLSLDAAMAASFDWRELVNILQGTKHPIDLTLPENVLEIRSHLMIHAHCHTENALSLKIESLLNQWHESEILKFSALNLEQIQDVFLTHNLNDRKAMGGMFWAIGSDPRAELDGLRRFLHQRYQILSIRRCA